MEIEMEDFSCGKYNKGDLLVNKKDKNKIIQIDSYTDDKRYFYYVLQNKDVNSLINGESISYISPPNLRPCSEINGQYEFIVNKPMELPVPVSGGKRKKARKSKRKKNKKSRKTRCKK